MQFKWKRIWLTIYVLKDMRSAAEPEYELFWATVGARRYNIFRTSAGNSFKLLST
jgi:hypothetical protein